MGAVDISDKNRDQTPVERDAMGCLGRPRTGAMMAQATHKILHRITRAHRGHGRLLRRLRHCQVSRLRTRTAALLTCTRTWRRKWTRYRRNIALTHRRSLQRSTGRTSGAKLPVRKPAKRARRTGRPCRKGLRRPQIRTMAQPALSPCTGVLHRPCHHLRRPIVTGTMVIQDRQKLRRAGKRPSHGRNIHSTQKCRVNRQKP